MDKNQLGKIGQYLSQAILLEVCAHPKPGLVTRCVNGSHSDMSIITFAMSSVNVGNSFQRIFGEGLEHRGDEFSLLLKVRAIGRVAEAELLRVTKGINTQRGILFCGGILAGACGYLARRERTDLTEIFDTIKKMTCGLVANELEQLPFGTKRTAGELLYQKYGITGIRGEVARGFPSVRLAGLPALEEAFARGLNINDALVHALIALMICVEDSNVVWRTDMQHLQKIQQSAFNIMESGGMRTAAGRSKIEALDAYCRLKQISPGGSADLLSVSVALYLLKHGEFPEKIM